MAKLPKALQEKVDQLVADYTPWGEKGLPKRPTTKQEQAEAVEKWLNSQLKPYQEYALVLVKEVDSVLRSLKQTIAKDRFLFRIDSDNLIKSPSGILEKMARKWRETPNPPTSPKTLDSLTDLGRFRVIVNFLSDAKAAKEELEQPYGAIGESLSDEQASLGRQFLLDGSNFEDLLNVKPEERGKGERCYKGVFRVADGVDKRLAIEVQIVTSLQEAWDKKDHYLIYEPRRAGIPIDPRHEQEIYAMSEMLFLADLAFDRLKEAREEQLAKVAQKKGALVNDKATK